MHKGIRRDKKHPIQNLFLISPSRLSSYQIFFSCFLSSLSIPQGLKDALADYELETAMVKEMRALDRNNT